MIAAAPGFGGCWPRRVVLALLAALLAAPGAAHAGDSTPGDLLAVLVPAAAWGATYLEDDGPGRCQLYHALGATAGVTYGLKTLVHHRGPDGDTDSFPSGHTALAFGGAAFLQRRYGWPYGLPAGLAASYVAWSRLDSDQHDLGDVAAGAGIAIIANLVFATPREQGVQVEPLVGAGESTVLGLCLRGSLP
ncbi:MAG: phosphatase PAP2 family protein [Thermodesulfobacteriota bacterium]